MKRVVFVLSVLAVMAMLLAALAMPATAKHAKPEQGGQPVFTFGESGESAFVIHCGPFNYEFLGEAGFHGALPLGAGQSDEAGNCVPPRD